MDVEKVKSLIEEKSLSKDLAVGKAMELVKETAVAGGEKPKKAAKSPKSKRLRQRNPDKLFPKGRIKPHQSGHTFS